MKRPFTDTPESMGDRSPILEENRRLIRKNNVLILTSMLTYIVIVGGGLVWAFSKAI